MTRIVDFLIRLDEAYGIFDPVWSLIHWLIEFSNRIAIRVFSRAISERLLKKAKLQDLYYIKYISAMDIMGNRGDKDKGFRESLWLERDCDRVLRNKIQASTIVVVTGGYSSGKSRVVYQFLKSEYCKQEQVYIPRDIDQIIHDLKRIKKYSNTIIVLDDINAILKNAVDWPNDEKLKDLFRYIQNKKIKTIVTIGKGVKGYLTFVRKSQDVGDDDYRGQQAEIEMPIVEIDDIRKGDECYRWCIGHLKNQGFSTVIGGYVPELERPINANLSNLNADEKDEMYQVVLSYNISTKYRRNEGKKKDNIQKLFIKLWNKDSNQFDNGLKNVINRGFLKEDMSNRLSYDIYDYRLYNSFISRCMSGKCGDIYKDVMENTKEAEKKQVDVYLKLGEDDTELYPILFSRLIVHSTFRDTAKYVEQRMWETIKKICKSDCLPIEYVDGPISDIIRILPDYYSAREYTESNNIKPTENVISALLTIAMKNTEDKELLKNYVKLLMKDFHIEPLSIHYYNCIEKLDMNYDIKRTHIVQNIYKNNLSDPYNESGYAKYCETLLRKARSNKRILFFWKNIASGLLLYPNSITRYLKELPKNEVKDGMLCNMFRHFCDNFLNLSFVKQGGEVEHFEYGIFIKTAIPIINSCKTYSGAHSIYDLALKWIEKNKKLYYNVDIQESASILVIQVFKKLREEGENTEDNINKACGLLEERLNHQWDDGEIIKITNSFIVAMPTYKKAMEFYKRIDSYINKLHSSKLSMDESTINTFLKVVYSELRHSRNVRNSIDNILEIEGKRKKNNLRCTSQYNTTIYTCARLLKGNGVTDEIVESIRSLADSCFNENIAENARIASIVKFEELREIIENYKKEIKNSNYDDNIAEAIASVIYLFMTTERFHSNDSLKDEISTLIKAYDKYIGSTGFSVS